MVKPGSNARFIINYSVGGKTFKKPITASSYDSACRIAYVCQGNFKIESVEAA